jgi:catechol 2,3-dioxygenase-like lactoylglutathione lyase family enzyme
MSLRLHHVALRARDPSVTTDFYASVIGLPVVRRDTERGSVWLDARGVVLMIEQAEAGEPPVPPHGKELLAFAIDDREAWRLRLEAAGVAIEAETAHTLYFRDPDGRRVAVSTYAFSGT